MHQDQVQELELVQCVGVRNVMLCLSNVCENEVHLIVLNVQRSVI